MDRNDWFELLELVKNFEKAINRDYPSEIKVAGLRLAQAVTLKADMAAELEGWYSELERRGF